MTAMVTRATTATTPDELPVSAVEEVCSGSDVEDVVDAGAGIGSVVELVLDVVDGMRAVVDGGLSYQSITPPIPSDRSVTPSTGVPKVSRSPTETVKRAGPPPTTVTVYTPSRATSTTSRSST